MLKRTISLFMPLPLLVMLFLANLNPLLGFLAIGLCAGLVLLLVLGIERAGGAAIGIGMFLAPWDGVRPEPITFITFSDVLLVIGMFLLVPTMIERHARVPSGYGIGAYLLLVSGLLASAIGPAPASSVAVMTRLVVAAVVLPVFFAWWRPGLLTVDKLATAYVLGQVVNSLAAFVIGPEINNRYKGLSTHVNYFGHTALLAIALLLYLWHRLGPQHRPWMLAAGGLFGVSIIQSGSRAAAIVAALLVVAYVLIERNAVTGSALVIGAGAAIPLLDWALAGVSKDSPLSRFLGDRTTDHSDSERTRHLEEGWERFLDKPILGDGFSNAPLLAHNIYLQVLVVVGVAGFIGFMLIFWAIGRPLFNPSHPLHRLGYAVFAYAAIGMLTNTLWDRFTWVVLGLAFLGNLDYGEEPAEPPPKRSGTLYRVTKATT